MIRSGILVTIVLFFATIVEPANSSGNNHSVTLNSVALDYARKLISQDHVVNDKRGEWAEHQASATDESEFMKQRGSEEYARWYLGIDESHRSDSKARYKFPLGDFKNVHRCALIAAENRARQYSYADIENAAKQLLELIATTDQGGCGRRQSPPPLEAPFSPAQLVRNASINSGNSSL